MLRYVQTWRLFSVRPRYTLPIISFLSLFLPVTSAWLFPVRSRYSLLNSNYVFFLSFSVTSAWLFPVKPSFTLRIMFFFVTSGYVFLLIFLKRCCFLEYETFLSFFPSRSVSRHATPHLYFLSFASACVEFLSLISNVVFSAKKNPCSPGWSLLVTQRHTAHANKPPRWNYQHQGALMYLWANFSHKATMAFSFCSCVVAGEWDCLLLLSGRPR